jgi:N-acetylmuramoyl-L-alanine amidase
MSNTTVPTALVECGFLSNPEECQKLADPAYQRQMAFAIGAGVLRYLEAA